MGKTLFPFILCNAVGSIISISNSDLTVGLDDGAIILSNFVQAAITSTKKNKTPVTLIVLFIFAMFSHEIFILSSYYILIFCFISEIIFL